MSQVKYWYQDRAGTDLTVPKVDQVVMCTVTGYTEAGYNVTLDAYGHQDGFIQLSELSSKRIKKNPATFLKPGDKHPVLVLSVSDVGRPDNEGNIEKVVDLSLKDVSETEKLRTHKDYTHALKLYNMCQRLEHITGIRLKEWETGFKSCLSEKSDLYEILHNRDLAESSGLPPALVEQILKHHTQLFGFSTCTKTKTVMIQCFRSDGNDYVKKVLLDACPVAEKEWTQEEINLNNELYNMHIRLIGLPKIQITVTACNESRAQELMEVTIKKLSDACFNFFVVMD